MYYNEIRQPDGTPIIGINYEEERPPVIDVLHTNETQQVQQQEPEYQLFQLFDSQMITWFTLFLVLASIGANATIICGITIGEYALIGAGAVVVKDVLPYALVVGNPSKQIGWISEYGHRLDFNEHGYAICTESKEEYELKDNKVQKVVSN